MQIERDGVARLGDRSHMLYSYSGIPLLLVAETGLGVQVPFSSRDTTLGSTYLGKVRLISSNIFSSGRNPIFLLPSEEFLQWLS
jgi:hypothetical protein